MPVINGNNNDNLLIGSSQIDLFFGFGGNDTIYAMSGDDEVLAGDGNDFINGGFGADRLDGGDGIDTADYGGSFAGVSIDLDTGIGIGGEAQGDVLINIENVSGSFYDDHLQGNANANVLTGNQGNDLLFGLTGNDMLDGGAGIDHMDGGAGIDTVTYASYNRGIGVNLGFNSGGDGDTLVSIENVIGSSFADFLYGSSGGNRLEGGAGEDWLNGLGGNDTLIGGDDNDALLGGDGDDVLMAGGGLNYLNGEGGTDTVSYARFGEAITVSLRGGDAFVGDVPKDSIVEVENVTGTSFGDSLTGDDIGNILNGLNGNDILIGFGGADMLMGGNGADIMSGGDGADRFDFNRIAESRGSTIDRITDFKFGDLIDLSAIDADTATAGDQAFSFIGQANFSGVAGQLRTAFINGGADTAVLADVNGDRVADFQVTLSGLNFLIGGDFVL